MSVQVRGLSKLLEQLTLIEAEMAAKLLAKVARVAFKPVLDAAKAMAPRDSGALADSLVLKVERPVGDSGVVRVGIKIGIGRGTKQSRLAAAAFGEAQSKGLPPARRWHFIELGTSKMAANPFLRPALDHNQGLVLDLLKGELVKRIQAAVRS